MLQISLVDNVSTESERRTKRGDRPITGHSLRVQVGPGKFQCTLLVLGHHSSGHLPFLFKDRTRDDEGGFITPYRDAADTRHRVVNG